MKDTVETLTPEQVLYDLAKKEEHYVFDYYKDTAALLTWASDLDISKFDEDTIKAFRTMALTELRRRRLVNDEAPDSFSTEFHGGGDSGDMESCKEPLVDLLFEWHLHNSVHFDWYNNDGGGGDMEWTLDDDTLIINGYSYYTETCQEMGGEEF